MSDIDPTSALSLLRHAAKGSEEIASSALDWSDTLSWLEESLFDNVPVDHPCRQDCEKLVAQIGRAKYDARSLYRNCEACAALFSRIADAEKAEPGTIEIQ